MKNNLLSKIFNLFISVTLVIVANTCTTEPEHFHAFAELLLEVCEMGPIWPPSLSKGRPHEWLKVAIPY